MSEERFDEQLSEELNKLAVNSLNGDETEVQIENVKYPSKNKVKVVFDPPIGNTFTKKMNIPHSKAEDCEFNNLLRATGRNLMNADKMIDDYVPAKYEDGEWQLRLPDPPRSYKEKIMDRTDDIIEGFLVLGGFSTWPVSGTVFCVWIVYDDIRNGKGIMLPILASGILWVTGAIIWCMIVLILRAILSMP